MREGIKPPVKLKLKKKTQQQKKNSSAVKNRIMTFVTNLLSIDEEIEFRVCSEGCRAGVLGGCVVVKDTVVIPLHIIHFLGLQIMLLEFDSD